MLSKTKPSLDESFRWSAQENDFNCDWTWCEWSYKVKETFYNNRLRSHMYRESCYDILLFWVKVREWHCVHHRLALLQQEKALTLVSFHLKHLILTWANVEIKVLLEDVKNFLRYICWKYGVVVLIRHQSMVYASYVRSGPRETHLINHLMWQTCGGLSKQVRRGILCITVDCTYDRKAIFSV